MKKYFILFLLLTVLLIISGCSRKNEVKEDDNYLQGLDQLSRSEFSTALQSFKKSINSNSAHTDSYIQSADILIKKEQYDEAIEILMNGEDFAHNPDKVHAKKGEVYFKKADFVNSLKSYEKALSANSNNLEAIIGKTESLVRQENFSEAKNFASKYDDNNSLEIKTILAFLYWDEPTKAISILDTIDNIEENSPALSEYKVFLVNTDSEEEKILINKMNIARIMINSGKPFYAMPIVNQIIVQNEYYEGGYLYKGIIMNLVGNYQQSKVELLNAIKYNSKNPEILRYLALSEAELGEIDMAKTNMELALSNSPQRTENYLIDYLYIQRKSKNNDAIINAYNELIQVSELKKDEYRTELAKIYCILDGNQENLLKLIEEIDETKFESNIERSEYSALNACLSLKNSDNETAKTNIDTALNLYSGNAFVYLVAYNLESDPGEKENLKNKLIDVDFDNNYFEYLEK